VVSATGSGDPASRATPPNTENVTGEVREEVSTARRISPPPDEELQ